MFEALRTKALYKEIEQRANARDPVAEYLRGQLSAALPHIAKTLADVRVYFRHFTDHSLSHSARIVENIGRILPRAQYSRSEHSDADSKLSTVDLFILVSSA